MENVDGNAVSHLFHGDAEKAGRWSRQPPDRRPGQRGPTGQADWCQASPASLKSSTYTSPARASGSRMP